MQMSVSFVHCCYADNRSQVVRRVQSGVDKHLQKKWRQQDDEKIGSQISSSQKLCAQCDGNTVKYSVCFCPHRSTQIWCFCLFGTEWRSVTSFAWIMIYSLSLHACWLAIRVKKRRETSWGWIHQASHSRANQFSGGNPGPWCRFHLVQRELTGRSVCCNRLQLYVTGVVVCGQSHGTSSLCAGWKELNMELKAAWRWLILLFTTENPFILNIQINQCSQ